MSTLFTKIVRGEIPCHKVAENDKFLAFLDIMPLVKGHVLVIPKTEVDYLFDMDDDLLGDMMIFAKKVALKMKSVLPCRRIGVTVIGLEVPHAHIHLIPINGVSDMDFSKPKLHLEKEEFEEIAKMIIQS
jgi:histidine triad (HIT) family protein